MKALAEKLKISQAGLHGMPQGVTPEDTRHYQRIVVALNETIRNMTEIDEAIRQHGNWPTAFSENNK